MTDLSRMYYESPVGLAEIVCSEKGVRRFELVDQKEHKENSNALCLNVAEQLDAYFRGERKQFDLPLDALGTPFQKSVWQGLIKIPYGVTASYGDIAKMLGKPTASRAVGGANGKNPIWIIVPCHRVIGANGTLTGYAGGIKRKKWLLDHEQKFKDK